MSMVWLTVAAWCWYAGRFFFLFPQKIYLSFVPGSRPCCTALVLCSLSHVLTMHGPLPSLQSHQWPAEVVLTCRWWLWRICLVSLRHHSCVHTSLTQIYVFQNKVSTWPVSSLLVISPSSLLWHVLGSAWSFTSPRCSVGTCWHRICWCCRPGASLAPSLDKVQTPWGDCLLPILSCNGPSTILSDDRRGTPTSFPTCRCIFSGGCVCRQRWVLLIVHNILSREPSIGSLHIIDWSRKHSIISFTDVVFCIHHQDLGGCTV